MDYQRIYNQVIERAQTRKLEGYKERHHINPKCLGGGNEKENIIELTAREHFLCHLLLCEIYPKNNKLRHALFLMTIGKQKVKEKQYFINSRTYERLKKEYSEMLTGKKQTEKTRKKKSKKMIEVWASKTKEEMSEIGLKRAKTRIINNTNFLTEEHKNKISKALKGRNTTEANNSRKKPILQYDLEGNFIREWDSISEANRNLKCDVGSFLKGRQKMAANSIWKYKNKDNE